MPIDTSIYGQFAPQPVAIKSPFEIQGQALQVQHGLNQNRLADMQFRQAEEQSQNRNRLRDLMAGGADEETLRRSGYLDEASKLGKDRRENMKLDNESMKAKREAEAAQFKLAHDKTGALLNIISSARDPQSYAQALQQAGAMGLDVSTAPQQFDPAFVANAGQQAQTAKERLEAEMKKRGYDIQALTQQESARHNRANEGIQVRGQNMTDARSRETAQGGRVPSGYRAKADGTLEFIPGGPADPNAAKKASPTEFQGKSATFGSRAQAADAIIAGLKGDFSPTGINMKNSMGQAPLIGGALEAGANMTLSDNSQKAEQAQRDFINAILRQESGAAIAASEFDNAKKQYFPQPGDSDAVKKQKANNRKLATQGLLNNAGQAPVGMSSAAPRKGLAGAAPEQDNDPLGLFR